MIEDRNEYLLHIANCCMFRNIEPGDSAGSYSVIAVHYLRNIQIIKETNNEPAMCIK